MGATKIINVLKDDKFEELLDIVKDTDASEVVFVLPKKAKAFRLEDQFLALETEIKKGDKSVAFLCSDPETNELAKKYGFDVLSTKTESVKPRLINSQIPLKSEAVAIPIIAEADDIDDDLHEEKELESSEEAEVIEEIPTEEEEEEIGEAVVASAKTRGMSDVVRPAAGKNLRVVQKDKRTVKVETRTEDDDIQSVWGQESADNIWADIAKPRVPKKCLGFAFGYRSFLKKGVGILTLASIVILAIVVYLTTGSARIEIKPRAQELSTQLKVIMSPNFSSVDNSFNRIPGQLFTISKSAY